MKNFLAIPLLITLSLPPTGCAFLTDALQVATTLADSPLGRLIRGCVQQSPKAQGLNEGAFREVGECVAGPVTWEQDSIDVDEIGELSIAWNIERQKAELGSYEAVKQMKKIDRKICNLVPERCE